MRKAALVVSALLLSAVLGFVGQVTLRTDPDRAVLVLHPDGNRLSHPGDPSPMLGEKADWRRMFSRPSGRLMTTMAYDSESDRVVLFGGYTPSENLEWNRILREERFAPVGKL